MGAGCYYTNNETGTKAFWIDLNPELEEEFEYDIESDFLLQSLEETLSKIGYDQDSTFSYSNGLFRIDLEWTYHGDGLVIKLEPHTEDSTQIYTLAMANHARSYERIERTLLERNYHLRIATSGYTSTQLSA